MILKVEVSMAKHLRQINNDHYLGRKVQYKIINLMVSKVREEIIHQIKT